jgi:hypothetical protein
MVGLKEEEFKEKLKETKESENAQQQAQDNIELNKIITGRQVINITGFGDVIFDFPGAGLAIEGDMLAAQFRTKHLRAGDLFNEEQLKHIYKQPTKVQIDGKETTVGDGLWTDKNEQEVTRLNNTIKSHQEMFIKYREEYQVFELDLIKHKPDSKKYNDLVERKNAVEEKARKEYTGLLDAKIKQLELATLRAKLFADSIEEMAFFEKVKLFAPSCVKKVADGKEVPLWSSKEEMLLDTHLATRVISIYSLFLRGLDVSFFADVPEGTIS